VIRLKSVYKTYGTRENPIRAARDVSFEIPAGAFVLLSGPSGAGKTTLLNLVAGMTTPDQGDIRVGGMDLTKLTDRALSRLRAVTIGFIFQFQSMIPSLNALENVMFPTLFVKRPGAKDRALNLLAKVGLGERRAAYQHELSIGQQRRVSIARALINRPAILLCDEPTGDLDPATETVIMDILKEAHQLGTTILMATHSQVPHHYATQKMSIDGGSVKQIRFPL